jgi:hypothetical protein
LPLLDSSDFRRNSRFAAFRANNAQFPKRRRAAALQGEDRRSKVVADRFTTIRRRQGTHDSGIDVGRQGTH